MNQIDCDYLIIGAGVIGLNIANELIERDSSKRVIILEKEKRVAEHSSGRNSGVLHAGFYYTADSLKAKFTRDGNQLMREYCEKNGLKINYCEKVVVANDESELTALEELYKRGIKNGVDVSLISDTEVDKKFKNLRTYKKALYSPSTSTIDPIEVCNSFHRELLEKGVQFRFNEAFRENLGENRVKTSLGNSIKATKIINCAGLYADKIAKRYGFSEKYTILPFKGIYLKYTEDDKPIDTNIYPVPNLNNPFLGVHYTVTVDNIIKIGPTAIPAFWRENYKGFDNFSMSELIEIIGYELKLFLFNRFNFRALAFDEIKKYNKKYFVNLALKMVKSIKKEGFNEWSKAGIRAQLLDTKSLELVQDFVVEGDEKSIHVLNAVSPAFTCSIPFSRWVVENYIEKDKIVEDN
jgi:L-2-hydroxyglutarate oxidase LhgO